MSGWKTWLGAGVVAASGVLRFLGYNEYASGVEAIGGALAAVGIGHKIEKASAK